MNQPRRHCGRRGRQGDDEDKTQETMFASSDEDRISEGIGTFEGEAEGRTNQPGRGSDEKSKDR
jgi:hypothetical protein